jgi:NADH-quinone oxidoreductase subunit J
MEAFLFYFGGALLLFGGIAMVTSRSAVAAACWLILAFLGSAGLYAGLHAPFLAVLQVLVYAGAIMVLFMFVIMMLEGPVMPAEARRPRLWVPVLSLIPAAVMLAALAIWLRPLGTTPFTATLPDQFGQPLRVAGLLLGDYLLAFELISVLLLVGIIGALALGKSERSQPWK